MDMENNFNESYYVNRGKNSLEYDRNSINFRATTTPIYLNINDKENEKYIKSNCITMVLDFNDIPQDVGEIFFKNYYTYTISILVMKISYTDSDRLKKWNIAIEQKKLMDNAHLDFQSQNYYCIKSSESKTDWLDVYKIKIILHQPSPNWKSFSIDEIKIVPIIQLQTHKNGIHNNEMSAKNLQIKTENVFSKTDLCDGNYICCSLI